MKKYDFCGWVTRSNIRCSDGRTIMDDAFKKNDGQTVPLIWNHNHEDPDAVVGNILLRNRPGGVYGYGSFNDGDLGKTSKLLVEHGDIDRLSIYANQLKENLSYVTEGNIREVSLVLASANPGAYIENVIRHGEELNDEAYMYCDESTIELYHSEEDTMDNEEKTVGEVLDTLNDEQKRAVDALIDAIMDDEDDVTDDESNEEDNNDDEEDGGDEEMKHSIFENNGDNEKVIMHAEGLKTILADAKRFGSLKESFLAHSEDYGIENIDYLFPDAQNLNKTPEYIKRDTGWVSKVMGSVHHTPFSRIKSTFADLREDEARAKGYIKGNLKKEEVFSLLKRTTTPTTVYKKQKLDRDDMIDITDFDVVAWLKTEMRMMLDEELARAFLIGDGRLASSDDHINETNIRPIAYDADLYTIKAKVSVAHNATDDAKAKAFIRKVIKTRKDYKGSGEPTLYTTEDMVTDCLLLEDQMGRPLYESIEKLRQVLRVKEIVTIPVMEGVLGTDGGALMGVICNLQDYNVGADKGGAINMFDDFDIDYNQMKYLIETRCSGALVKPFSAIALELDEANS